jgi:hypothetical protein
MKKNITFLYKLLCTFLLISQYEMILRQNSFLAMVSYILILLLLFLDSIYYIFVTVFKKEDEQ